MRRGVFIFAAVHGGLDFSVGEDGHGDEDAGEELLIIFSHFAWMMGFCVMVLWGESHVEMLALCQGVDIFDRKVKRYRQKSRGLETLICTTLGKTFGMGRFIWA